MDFWHVFSYIYFFSAIISALIIAFNLYYNPQRMRIMAPVWILTGLWAGVLGLFCYFRYGITRKGEVYDSFSMAGMDMNENQDLSMSDMGGMEMKSGSDVSMSDMGGMEMKSGSDVSMSDMGGMDMKGSSDVSMKDMGMDMKSGSDIAIKDMVNVKVSSDVAGKEKNDFDKKPSKIKKIKRILFGHTRPMWQKTVLSAFHCGAGCTLADIIGEGTGYIWLRHLYFWDIAYQWVLDYILALLIGILFQYAAIHSMQKMSFGKTILKAVKVDFFSLTGWQLGMYVSAWFIFFVFPGKMYYADSVMFWFIMQITMSVGFLVAYPINYILIKTGIKPGM